MPSSSSGTFASTLHSPSLSGITNLVWPVDWKSGVGGQLLKVRLRCLSSTLSSLDDLGRLGERQRFASPEIYKMKRVGYNHVVGVEFASGFPCSLMEGSVNKQHFAVTNFY